MNSHEFALILRTNIGPDEFLDRTADRLIDAGCDDATFSVWDGVPHATFVRAADGLADAIRSAIGDVESIPGVAVERVQADELVTASEIAHRVGRTRQSVHLLGNGARGPGGFPAPVPGISADRTKLYEWTDVARWFSDALGEPPRADPNAPLIAAFNAALAARRRTRELEEPAQRNAIASLLR